MRVAASAAIEFAFVFCMCACGGDRCVGSEVAWRGAAGGWATEGGYVGAVGGRHGWGRVAGCIRVAVGGRVPEVMRGVVHATLVEHCVVSGGGWGQL